MLGIVHAPRNRSEAWRCVLVNQFACPGLGTILGGDKTGFFQFAIMLVGFVLFAGYLGWLIYQQLHALFGDASRLALFDQEKFPKWQVGAAGLALCFFAWTWALFSSIRLLRSAPENRPPAHLPPRL